MKKNAYTAKKTLSLQQIISIPDAKEIMITFFCYDKRVYGSLPVLILMVIMYEKLLKKNIN